jgi:hypothetical protein
MAMWKRKRPGIEENRVRCTRTMSMRYGSLVAEARIPCLDKRDDDLRRAMADIDDVILTAHITTASMGFWVDGSILRYRARLGGDEKVIRRALAAKGWRWETPTARSPWEGGEP